VVGSGAGKADLCHANIVQNCSIHHTGRDKYDAPAIVLWHCAFNNISGNHIHHVPSKAMLLGGIRSLVFDPFPLNGSLTVHEASWTMTRWAEIDKADIVHVTGTEENVVLNPPISAADKFAGDIRVAAYRYTRGNRVSGNLFDNIHDASTVYANNAVTSIFFGDGVIYVSGVGVDPTDLHFEPNYIESNVFAITGPQEEGGLGVPVLESVYADGFGGSLSVANNAVIGMLNGGFSLCTWWGNSPISANVFYQLFGAEMISQLNCDGNDIVHPTGNVHLDDNSDTYHDPLATHLNSYEAVYQQVCQWKNRVKLQGSTAMPFADEFLKLLSQQIVGLGGSSMDCS